VASGEVDVISAFSSDGRVAAYHLEIMQDPLQVIPPYDAIILASPARASDPVLHRALDPLVGSIPIERMREANYSVDRESNPLSPLQAAQALARTLDRSR
jgi:osmoprotectant transport system permease protein